MRIRIFDFFRAYLFVVTTFMPAFIAAALWVAFVAPLNQDFGFYDAIAILAAGALAWVVSALTIYQIIWKFLRLLRFRLGAAIETGSTVRILCGVHRNKVAKVYETWDERGQVRVDLGEEAKRAVKDVYMDYQLERVNPWN